MNEEYERQYPEKGSRRASANTNRGPVRKSKWIGNIRCYFHDAHGKPRVTIGPNWGFSIGLIGLVAGILYICLKGLINIYNRNAAWYWLLIGTILILFGLACVLRTLLGDPGIPTEIYRLHAEPELRNGQNNLPTVNDRGHDLCPVCQVYKPNDRTHCSLCDVCIDGIDHHCVFYSKCIGRGNVLTFNLSIASFLVNIAYFMILQMFLTLSPTSGVHHHTATTNETSHDQANLLI